MRNQFEVNAKLISRNISKGQENGYTFAISIQWIGEEKMFTADLFIKIMQQLNRDLEFHPEPTKTSLIFWA